MNCKSIDKDTDSAAAPVEVVAALIRRDGRFMICQRPADKARALLWEFVGGKVEPGETKQAALIRECREAGAEVVLFATPLSQVFLEYFDGWDEYLEQIKALAAEAGVTAPVLDFNLYKGRAQLFDDSEDFYNWNHLNYAGSQKFSKIFADAINSAYSEDLFYNSYEEMAAAR